MAMRNQTEHVTASPLAAMPQSANDARTSAGLMDASAKPFPFARRTLFNAGIMGLAEATVLVGSLMLGAFIRMVWKGDPMFATWMWYLVVAWLIGAIVSKLLPGWGLGPVEELRRTVLLLVGVFGATIAMLFWGKAAEATSRFVLTTGFLFSLLLIPLVRLQVKRMLLARDAWGIPAVLYTDEQTGPPVVDALEQERGLGYRPYGVFTDRRAGSGSTLAGLPVLGTTRQFTAQAPVAILALPGLPRETIADMLEDTLSAYRKVVVIPDLLEAPSLWVKPRDLVGMLGLEISSNLLDPLARFTKRTVDILASGLTAPIWAPLCALLGLLVWLEDRANPIFAQERIGKNGRLFKTWKFRTMHPNAEHILEERLQNDAALRAEWQTQFKLRKDPRITRIGAFLRRTSLDELPQLLHVLRGEMSLVGPRPLPRYHYEELPGRVRKLRDRVRPGITGLWQVSGRSDAGPFGMQKWDTYYVRNWSAWLDIVILVRTIRTVATGHGAY
jgi:Undecaprenyl-phosphate galactose phosphotransferase WbaP